MNRQDDHHDPQPHAVRPIDHPDSPPRCSLLDLFESYREAYPDDQAIARLLGDLRIKHYFHQPPTVRQMQVLLAWHQHLNRKSLAKQLAISSHTVASHLQHMKNKLMTPNYAPVLMRLREIPLRVARPVLPFNVRADFPRVESCAQTSSEST